MILEILLQSKSLNRTGRVHKTNMDRNVPIAAKIYEAKRSQTIKKEFYYNFFPRILSGTKYLPHLL